MKAVGYIGTALSLLLALVLQQFDIDAFTRLLTWVVPSAVSLISWLVAIALRAKKLRDMIMADIASMIDRAMESRIRGLEKDMDEKLTGMQSGVVDEVWNRLDTIMNLKRIGEQLASDHEKSQNDR